MSSNEEFVKAVEKGEIESVRKLLETGANVEATDKIGFTPLSHAAYNGNSEMTALLIEHGADVNNSNTLGIPPLAYAICYGGFDVAELLLEKGADINAACGQFGNTSLPQWVTNTGINDHIYADKMLQRTKFIVEHGADISSISTSELHKTYGQNADEIISLLKPQKATPLPQTESKPPSHKNPETVEGFRERFTSDEWDTLRLIPFKLIIFYNARTNHQFTETYLVSMAKEVVKAKSYRNLLAREALQSLTTDFGELQQRVNKDTRPLLKYAFDVEKILQAKIPPEEAKGFKHSISFLCMNIAYSIGNQNAFSKSSQDMGFEVLMFMNTLGVELNELNPASIIETQIISKPINKSATTSTKKWWEFWK